MGQKYMTYRLIYNNSQLSSNKTDNKKEICCRF